MLTHRLRKPSRCSIFVVLTSPVITLCLNAIQPQTVAGFQGTQYNNDDYQYISASGAHTPSTNSLFNAVVEDPPPTGTMVRDIVTSMSTNTLYSPLILALLVCTILSGLYVFYVSRILPKNSGSLASRGRHANSGHGVAKNNKGLAGNKQGKRDSHHEKSSMPRQAKGNIISATSATSSASQSSEKGAPPAVSPQTQAKLDVHTAETSSPSQPFSLSNHVPKSSQRRPSQSTHHHHQDHGSSSSPVDKAKPVPTADASDLSPQSSPTTATGAVMSVASLDSKEHVNIQRAPTATADNSSTSTSKRDESSSDDDGDTTAQTAAETGLYFGELMNGIPHGFGTYTYVDNSKYEGEWESGRYHGQGCVTLPASSPSTGNVLKLSGNKKARQKYLAEVRGKSVRASSGTLDNPRRPGSLGNHHSTSTYSSGGYSSGGAAGGAAGGGGGHPSVFDIIPLSSHTLDLYSLPTILINTLLNTYYSKSPSGDGPDSSSLAVSDPRKAPQPIRFPVQILSSFVDGDLGKQATIRYGSITAEVNYAKAELHGKGSIYFTPPSVSTVDPTLNVFDTDDFAAFQWILSDIDKYISHEDAIRHNNIRIMGANSPSFVKGDSKQPSQSISDLLESLQSPSGYYNVTLAGFQCKWSHGVFDVEKGLLPLWHITPLSQSQVPSQPSGSGASPLYSPNHETIFEGQNEDHSEGSEGDDDYHGRKSSTTHTPVTAPSGKKTSPAITTSTASGAGTPDDSNAKSKKTKSQKKSKESQKGKAQASDQTPAVSTAPVSSHHVESNSNSNSTPTQQADVVPPPSPSPPLDASCALSHQLSQFSQFSQSSLNSLEYFISPAHHIIPSSVSDNSSHSAYSAHLVEDMVSLSTGRRATPDQGQAPIHDHMGELLPNPLVPSSSSSSASAPVEGGLFTSNSPLSSPTRRQRSHSRGDHDCHDTGEPFSRLHRRSSSHSSTGPLYNSPQQQGHHLHLKKNKASLDDNTLPDKMPSHTKNPLAGGKDHHATQSKTDDLIDSPSTFSPHGNCGSSNHFSYHHLASRPISSTLPSSEQQPPYRSPQPQGRTRSSSRDQEFATPSIQRTSSQTTPHGNHRYPHQPHQPHHHRQHSSANTTMTEDFPSHGSSSSTHHASFHPLPHTPSSIPPPPPPSDFSITPHRHSSSASSSRQLSSPPPPPPPFASASHSHVRHYMTQSISSQHIHSSSGGSSGLRTSSSLLPPPPPPPIHLTSTERPPLIPPPPLHTPSVSLSYTASSSQSLSRSSIPPPPPPPLHSLSSSFNSSHTNRRRSGSGLVPPPPPTHLLTLSDPTLSKQSPMAGSVPPFQPLTPVFLDENMPISHSKPRAQQQQQASGQKQKPASPQPSTPTPAQAAVPGETTNASSPAQQQQATHTHAATGSKPKRTTSAQASPILASSAALMSPSPYTPSTPYCSGGGGVGGGAGSIRTSLSFESSVHSYSDYRYQHTINNTGSTNVTGGNHFSSASPSLTGRVAIDLAHSLDPSSPPQTPAGSVIGISTHGSMPGDGEHGYTDPLTQMQSRLLPIDPQDPYADLYIQLRQQAQMQGALRSGPMSSSQSNFSSGSSVNLQHQPQPSPVRGRGHSRAAPQQGSQPSNQATPRRQSAHSQLLPGGSQSSSKAPSEMSIQIGGCNSNSQQQNHSTTATTTGSRPKSGMPSSSVPTTPRSPNFQLSQHSNGGTGSNMNTNPDILLDSRGNSAGAAGGSGHTAGAVSVLPQFSLNDPIPASGAVAQPRRRQQYNTAAVHYTSNTMQGAYHHSSSIEDHDIRSVGYPGSYRSVHSSQSQSQSLNTFQGQGEYPMHLNQGNQISIGPLSQHQQQQQQPQPAPATSRRSRRDRAQQQQQQQQQQQHHYHQSISTASVTHSSSSGVLPNAYPNQHPQYPPLTAGPSSQSSGFVGAMAPQPQYGAPHHHYHGQHPGYQHPPSYGAPSHLQQPQPPPQQQLLQHHHGMPVVPSRYKMIEYDPNVLHRFNLYVLQLRKSYDIPSYQELPSPSETAGSYQQQAISTATLEVLDDAGESISDENGSTSTFLPGSAHASFSSNGPLHGGHTTSSQQPSRHRERRSVSGIAMAIHPSGMSISSVTNPTAFDTGSGSVLSSSIMSRSLTTTINGKQSKKMRNRTIKHFLVLLKNQLAKSPFPNDNFAYCVSSGLVKYALGKELPQQQGPSSCPPTGDSTPTPSPSPVPAERPFNLTPKALSKLNTKLTSHLESSLQALEKLRTFTDLYRLECCSYLTHVIRTLWPNCDVFPCGSFVLQTTLPSSDLDFVVSLPLPLSLCYKYWVDSQSSAANAAHTMAGNDKDRDTTTAHGSRNSRSRSGQNGPVSTGGLQPPSMSAPNGGGSTAESTTMTNTTQQMLKSLQSNVVHLLQRQSATQLASFLVTQLGVYSENYALLLKHQQQQGDKSMRGPGAPATTTSGGNGSGIDPTANAFLPQALQPAHFMSTQSINPNLNNNQMIHSQFLQQHRGNAAAAAAASPLSSAASFPPGQGPLPGQVQPSAPPQPHGSGTRPHLPSTLFSSTRHHCVCYLRTLGDATPSLRKFAKRLQPVLYSVKAILTATIPIIKLQVLVPRRVAKKLDNRGQITEYLAPVMDNHLDATSSVCSICYYIVQCDISFSYTYPSPWLLLIASRIPEYRHPLLYKQYASRFNTEEQQEELDHFASETLIKFPFVLSNCATFENWVAALDNNEQSTVSPTHLPGASIALNEDSVFLRNHQDSHYLKNAAITPDNYRLVHTFVLNDAIKHFGPLPLLEPWISQYDGLTIEYDIDPSNALLTSLSKSSTDAAKRSFASEHGGALSPQDLPHGSSQGLGPGQAMEVVPASLQSMRSKSNNESPPSAPASQSQSLVSGHVNNADALQMKNPAAYLLLQQQQATTVDSTLLFPTPYAFIESELKRQQQQQQQQQSVSQSTSRSPIGASSVIANHPNASLASTQLSFSFSNMSSSSNMLSTSNACTVNSTTNAVSQQQQQQQIRLSRISLSGKPPQASQLAVNAASLQASMQLCYHRRTLLQTYIRPPYRLSQFSQAPSHSTGDSTTGNNEQSTSGKRISALDPLSPNCSGNLAGINLVANNNHNNSTAHTLSCHTSLSVAHVLASFMSTLPQLRAMLTLLKTFLAANNLNEPYSGGISSYMSALLCIAFLLRRSYIQPLRTFSESLTAKSSILASSSARSTLKSQQLLNNGSGEDEPLPSSASTTALASGNGVALTSHSNSNSNAVSARKNSSSTAAAAAPPGNPSNSSTNSMNTVKTTKENPYEEYRYAKPLSIDCDPHHDNYVDMSDPALLQGEIPPQRSVDHQDKDQDKGKDKDQRRDDTDSNTTTLEGGPSIGQLFCEFLFFYGHIFDPVTCGIALQSPAIFYSLLEYRKDKYSDSNDKSSSNGGGGITLSEVEHMEYCQQNTLIQRCLRPVLILHDCMVSDNVISHSCFNFIAIQKEFRKALDGILAGDFSLMQLHKFEDMAKPPSSSN